MGQINKKFSGFTVRAFITGAFLCFLVAIIAQYSINIVHGSYLAIDHMPAGGIFIFFVFTLFINTILRKMGIGFSSSEQLLIYTMIIVCSSVVTMGFGGQILPMLAAPSYYAAPQNRWAEIIQPHIKPWLVPQGEENIRTFFEGLPKGASIPWMTWVKPLLAWIPFILAIYLVMVCIMVILRKQWVEREKLIFPLVHLPVEMTKEEEKTKPLSFASFYRNKIMWIGFAIPFIISSINALHHYFHFIPPIQLAQSVPIFRETTSIHFRLSFPVMGLAYLIHHDVAFSLWFFSLLFTALKGISNVTGMASSENIGIYGVDAPIFAHVGTGAFLVFVLFGLWMAKSHLRDVFRKAFRRDSKIDDSSEMLSYRAAVIGLILGIIFIISWLVLSGISLLISLLFLSGALIFFLGLTRVVAEAGIPTLTAPTISSSAVISSIGSSHIGASGLTGLGFTYVYHSDIRTFVMSPVAHGLKMSEEMAGRKSLLFLGMFLAIIIGIVTSLWLVLQLSYRHGGINLNSWYFVTGPQYPWIYTTEKILHPEGPNGIGWFCKIIGAGVMFIMVFMRNRFLWWPLHPIGFVIGSNTWIWYLWFTIFLSWLFKSLILRYGGPRLYRKTIPFFLGLILGQYTCAGMWVVIDYFTKMTGNMVFWI